MASTLKETGTMLAATRTVVLTAPAAKQTIVVSGTVANVNASRATYFVTIEVGSGATYRTIIKDAPVPYGGSLIVPKIILTAGKTLNMTASAAASLDAHISYVEKD